MATLEPTLGGPRPQPNVDNEAEIARAIAEATDRSRLELDSPAGQLELPGATVTDVGVDIVGPVDVDQVVANLGRLQRSDTWTRWAVGDLFNALVDAHDGDPAPAYQAVAGLGYEANWLNRSAAVAHRIPHGHRRPGLSWSHHVAVAVDHLPVDEQPRWLGLAVANGWSARLLEAAIADHVAGPRDELGLEERPPAPKLPRNVVATIFEAAALSPSGWVKVHPASGQVLSIGGDS